MEDFRSKDTGRVIGSQRSNGAEMPGKKQDVVAPRRERREQITRRPRIRVGGCEMARRHQEFGGHTASRAKFRSHGFGGISKGLSIVTRAQAPVAAPADGWVLYAGDYLNYGQIVILDVGQDHTILLAGLAAVNAKVGQFVRMGETLGTMGSRTIGRTVASSAGASRPTLYIEMRNKNTPIDPTGWWATPTNPTQSG